MKYLKSRPVQIAAVAVVILLFVLFLVMIVSGKKEGEAEEEYDYTYTVAEQVLADEVIVYLQNAAGIGDPVSRKTANEAVESYRLILQSNVDVVNDDHTQAIQGRIARVLSEHEEEDEALSGADIQALSAGVAEIVWRSILSQIEDLTENVEESDYFYLAESMQQQIKELEERKMKVSIRANINSNTSTDLTAEELLALLADMSDEEIARMANALGLSLDELYALLKEGAAGIVGDKELEELLAKLQKEMENDFDKKLEKEIANGKNGTNGTNGNNGTSTTTQTSSGTNGTGGKNGTNGKDGQDGKDGKDGKAGQDGDSIFIMYAESATGENMTKKPTSSTKYMGTYVGPIESANAADYTWTRYSDATISYSKETDTLYITQ